MQHPLYIFVRERERGPLRKQRTQWKPQEELGGPQRERCPVEYGKGAVRPQGWGGGSDGRMYVQKSSPVFYRSLPSLPKDREKKTEREKDRERETERETEREIEIERDRLEDRQRQTDKRE